MNDLSPASIRQRAIDYIGVAAADGDEAVALKRALAALRVYSNDAEITVITCMLLNDWQRFEDSLALLYALRTTDLRESNQRSPRPMRRCTVLRMR